MYTLYYKCVLKDNLKKNMSKVKGVIDAWGGVKGGGGLSCPEASVIGGDQNVSAVFVFIYVMSKMIFKFRRFRP